MDEKNVNAILPCSSGILRNNGSGMRTNDNNQKADGLRERSQGFQDGKLAKKKKFKCHWSCDEYLPTLKEAAEHKCESRAALYKDLVEMNLIANFPPLRVYLDEMNGGVGGDLPIESLKDAADIKKETINMKKSLPEGEAPSWNAIQEAFPATGDRKFKTARWLKTWSSNFKKYPVEIGYYDLYWKK